MIATIPVHLTKPEARQAFCVAALHGLVQFAVALPFPIPDDHALYECVDWDENCTVYRHIPVAELPEWRQAMQHGGLQHINFQYRGVNADTNPESTPMHPPIGFYPLIHTDINGATCTTLPTDGQEILAWDAANPGKGEMRGAFIVAGEERIFLHNGLARASFTHWKGLQETNAGGAAIALTPEPSLIDPCQTLSLVGGTNDAMARDAKLAGLRADHNKRYQETLDSVMPIEKAEALIAAADAAHHGAFLAADVQASTEASEVDKEAARPDGFGAISMDEHLENLGSIRASIELRSMKRAAPKITCDEAATDIANLLADAASIDRVDEMRKLQANDSNMHRRVGDKLAIIGVARGLRGPLDGIDAEKEIERVFKHTDRTAEIDAEINRAQSTALAELREQLDRVIGFQVNMGISDAMSNAAEFLRRYAPDGHGLPQSVRVEPTAFRPAPPYEKPYIVVTAATLDELTEKVDESSGRYKAFGGLTVLPEPQDDPLALTDLKPPRFVQVMVRE